MSVYHGKTLVLSNGTGIDDNIENSLTRTWSSNKIQQKLTETSGANIVNMTEDVGVDVETIINTEDKEQEISIEVLEPVADTSIEIDLMHILSTPDVTFGAITGAYESGRFIRARTNDINITPVLLHDDVIKVDIPEDWDSNNMLAIFVTSEYTIMTGKEFKIKADCENTPVENSQKPITSGAVYQKFVEEGVRSDGYADSKVAALESIVIANKQALDDLDTRLSGGIASLEANDQQTTQNMEQISTNVETINTNISNINSNMQRITNLETEVSEHHDDITTLKANVATNASNIAANQTEIYGILDSLTNRDYFVGNYLYAETIRNLDGFKGAYAYCAETGGSKWIWNTTTEAWEDSHEIVASQTVNRTLTTPLMDGDPTIGTEFSYAAGDHKHPTDTTRASAAALESHVSDKGNPHAVTRAQVGLGNVDNTSDIDKPISTATQIALNGKADKATTVAGYGITDAITDDNFETKLKSMFLDMIYPVGSIYMSTASGNPGTKFGGTWVAWGAGRVPVGMGSNGTTNYNVVNSTGGSESASHTHAATNTGGTTLTVNQIPSHNHNGSTGSSKQPLPYKEAAAASGTKIWAYVTNDTSGLSSDTTQWMSSGHTHSIPAQGGGASHNHSIATQTATTDVRQPYITCYMWRRTA